MTRTILRLVLAAAAATAGAAAPAYGQQPAAPVQLLDVPYVPQSEELCGGAAAAMVMRYWGATGIYAESFADLVDRSAGGIRGEDLLRTVRERGWQAISLAGDAATVQRTLSERRPPIALIEDRPGRYHYVVVVGWRDGRVVLHDPARAPFRVLEEGTFLRAWGSSGYWMMLALPDPNAAREMSRAREPARAGTGARSRGRCGAAVDEGVDLAGRGALDQAQSVLERAALACPGDAAPWRELAGVHALRRDWGRAATDARRALDRDATDDHAARILATSLYLEEDPAGALAAWNLVGEPVVDLVEIRGLDRTRFSVAHRALDLRPQTLLTPDALQRAGRRLDALPSVQSARVSYTPLDNGLARVTGALLERPVVPAGRIALLALGLHAAADRELTINVASPTGGGELIHAAWRWWEARPRLTAGLRMPVRSLGTLILEGTAERQTYGNDSGRIEEQRRRVLVGLTDWATGSLAWETHLALERVGAESSGSAAAGVRYMTARDRVTVRGSAEVWRGDTRTWSAAAAADWRSRTSHEGSVWLARAGAAAVGAAAPFALWPGAGVGQGRSELLRAHPLLHDGVIRDGVFGRRLVHAGAELRTWGGPVWRVLRVAPAVFVDTARAFDAPAFADARTHVDVGAGLRVAFPGAGVLRADVARGLADGRMAVSVGWAR